MTTYKNLNDHERFKKLGALANSGSLDAGEWVELWRHMQICDECRETCRQYHLLVREGMPMLAASYGHQPEDADWNKWETHEKLFARVRSAQRRFSYKLLNTARVNALLGSAWHLLKGAPAHTALAACLVIAIGLVVYRLASGEQALPRQARALQERSFEKLAAEKKSVTEVLAAETTKLSQLQAENLEKEREIAQLQTELEALVVRENKLTAANAATEGRARELDSANHAIQDQLEAVSQRRDALEAQLGDSEEAYQSVQAELSNLRDQRQQSAEVTTALESKVEELSAVNRDQARRLRDDEQYLASDRDIRELMGARDLYIADVYDVDGHSHTRKPHGRVFYTHGKSLIFYAFDLDQQPGVQNASMFQAWGQTKDEDKALSLGILYKDKEANRRWVLRCDNSQQLAEINAVFVTVEPHGGSLRPSNKPFLYALLRRESNHP